MMGLFDDLGINASAQSDNGNTASATAALGNASSSDSGDFLIIQEDSPARISAPQDEPIIMELSSEEMPDSPESMFAESVQEIPVHAEANPASTISAEVPAQTQEAPVSENDAVVMFREAPVSAHDTEAPVVAQSEPAQKVLHPNDILQSSIVQLKSLLDGYTSRIEERNRKNDNLRARIEELNLEIMRFTEENTRDHEESDSVRSMIELFESRLAA